MVRTPGYNKSGVLNNRGRVTLAADPQKILGCEGIGYFPPALLLRIGFVGGEREAIMF
jgi:hypothetical protein